MSKRSQVTIFIVIGILLLLGIALILFMQRTAFDIERPPVPDDIVPLYLYVEAPSPCGRQDSRTFDRSVQLGHPAASRRQSAVRRSALRRDGGVGA